MICKKCGENLPDNARECFTCGAKVRREAVVEPEVVSAPAVAELKPPRPSGEVLKEVFSSGSYLIMCIFLIIHTALSLTVYVAALFSPELSAEETTVSIINIVMQLILIVPALAIYVRAKTTKDPAGTDFIKLFKIMHIYMIANLLAAIIDSVTSFISMAALSLFSVSAVIVEIASLVIAILPVYAAFQLTGSLINSCEKGRMVLEGAGVLRVYVIIYSVLFITLTVVSAILAVTESSFAWIFVALFLCYSLLMLRIHNFLCLLQAKSKY